MYRWLCIAFLFSLISFTGCQTNINTATPTVQFLPVQTKDPGMYMEALLQGKLVIDESGYLRIHDTLIIWPYHYSFISEGSDIWITNEKAEKIIKVGDPVKIGGGEYPEQYVSQAIGQSLPDDCKGPFWLAGQIMP